MVTEVGTSSSGSSYAESMVATSLPLPVGAFMIAFATVAVAVNGSIGVVLGADDEEKDGSGAIII